MIDGEESTASVYTGSVWEDIQHGRKRCANGCGATVRVGFVWDGGKKICTMTRQAWESDRDQVALLSNTIGISDALFLALWFTEGQFYPAKRIDLADIVPDNVPTSLRCFIVFLCDCVEEKRRNKDRK